MLLLLETFVALLWTWHYSRHYWPFSPVVRFNGIRDAATIFGATAKVQTPLLGSFFVLSSREKRHLIYDREGILDECVTFVAAHPSTSNYIWVCFKAHPYVNPLNLKLLLNYIWRKLELDFGMSRHCLKIIPKKYYLSLTCKELQDATNRLLNSPYL